MCVQLSAQLSAGCPAHSSHLAFGTCYPCLDRCPCQAYTCNVQISAKSGDGVDELLETLLLLAELEELKANPLKPARGTVIEAHMDRRCSLPAHSIIK